MYVVVGFAVLQFAGLCRCWCCVDWCLLWGLVVTFARSCLSDYGFRGWLGGCFLWFDCYFTGLPFSLGSRLVRWGFYCGLRLTVYVTVDACLCLCACCVCGY